MYITETFMFNACQHTIKPTLTCLMDNASIITLMDNELIITISIKLHTANVYKHRYVTPTCLRKNYRCYSSIQ
jgi:hypothetical protein